MPKTFLICVAFVCPLFFSSCNELSAQESSTQESSEIYHDSWIDRNKNGKRDPYENPELSVDERIEDLLGWMNIDEKTAQMGTIYGYMRVL